MKYLLFFVLFAFGASASTPAGASTEIPEVVFIKLGRSIVTNINVPYSPRLAVIRQFAEELARVMKAKPQMKIIIGHGSGSFGRTAAKEQKYHEQKGFPTVNSAAIVAKAALDLHAMIISELVKAGVPAFSMPPSATGVMDSKSKRLVSMDVLQIRRILEMGGVPVVFGDVIPTDEGGAYIASTEEIFSLLSKHFNPSSVFLLGEVFLGEMEGIYQSFNAQLPQPGQKNAFIPEITPELWSRILAEATSSPKNHETKEIVKKVNIMIELVKKNPRVKVYVASGIAEGTLENLLVFNTKQPSGMLIQAGPQKHSKAILEDK